MRLKSSVDALKGWGKGSASGDVYDAALEMAASEVGLAENRSCYHCFVFCGFSKALAR